LTRPAPGTASAELGAEVGRDAEGEDVQFQVVDDTGGLVALVRREELRLVGDHIVATAAFGEAVDETGAEVEALRGLDRFGHQTQAGGEFALPGPVVTGEDHALKAAGGPVVLGLKSEGLLS